MACGSSKVVEHLPYNPKVGLSNPALGAG